jgi:ketosteroid isomerase-like protein
MMSCKQSLQPEQSLDRVSEDLKALNHDYASALMNGETEECLSMMTPDFVNYISFQSTQRLKEVEKMIFDLTAKNTIEHVEFDRTELFVHGNMAYEFGILTQDITPKSSGKKRTSKARYISVFKRHEGVWKYHRWMPQPETPSGQTK